jgi:alpha-L-rhamnosidase
LRDRTAQALALDTGLVPDDRRTDVINALVGLVRAYHPTGDGSPLSGGIGTAPTPANPNGMTTTGERWARGDADKHVFLTQIDLGPHRTRQSPVGRQARIAHWSSNPKPVGDLRCVSAAATARGPPGGVRGPEPVLGAR